MTTTCEVSSLYPTASPTTNGLPYAVSPARSSSIVRRASSASAAHARAVPCCLPDRPSLIESHQSRIGPSITWSRHRTGRSGRRLRQCCLSVSRMVVPSGGPPNVERSAEEAARRGERKDPPICGREPAEPTRHTDLSRRGLPRPVALRMHLRRSSVSCAMVSSRRVSVSGCRSGIPAGTVCTHTSQSAGSSRAD